MFDIKICTLKHGDYEVGRHILIERKTAVDFLHSLKTGRIFRQAYSNVQLQKRCLLIIEGLPEEFANSQVTKEAIQGALLHLSVFAGVSVLYTSDIKETARLIFYLGRQLLRNHHINHNIRQKIYKPGKANPHNNTPVSLLTCIPGIGTHRAQILLSNFGTLKNIALSDVTSFKMLKGFSDRLAGTIYSYFNGGLQEKT